MKLVSPLVAVPGTYYRGQCVAMKIMYLNNILAGNIYYVPC